MSGWVSQAVVQAGVIILITAAGGAFGKVAPKFWHTIRNRPLAIESQPWHVVTIHNRRCDTNCARLINGSYNYNRITTGTSVVSHTNDSYVWVFSQLSKMDVKAGYKS